MNNSKEIYSNFSFLAFNKQYVTRLYAKFLFLGSKKTKNSVLYEKNAH